MPPPPSLLVQNPHKTRVPIVAYGVSPNPVLKSNDRSLLCKALPYRRYGCYHNVQHGTGVPSNQLITRQSLLNNQPMLKRRESLLHCTPKSIIQMEARTQIAVPLKKTKKLCDDNRRSQCQQQKKSGHKTNAPITTSDSDGIHKKRRRVY